MDRVFILVETPPPFSAFSFIFTREHFHFPAPFFNLIYTVCLSKDVTGPCYISCLLNGGKVFILVETPPPFLPSHLFLHVFTFTSLPLSILAHRTPVRRRDRCLSPHPSLSPLFLLPPSLLPFLYLGQLPLQSSPVYCIASDQRRVRVSATPSHLYQCICPKT